MNSDITVQELHERLSKGEQLLVIDVREPYEYEEYNIGGKLIPLGELSARIHDFDDHMDDEIVVHCRSGARSSAAQDYMKKMGFTGVRNLVGGIIAWQQAYMQ